MTRDAIMHVNDTECALCGESPEEGIKNWVPTEAGGSMALCPACRETWKPSKVLKERIERDRAKLIEEVEANCKTVDAREWLKERATNSIGDHHWCDPDEDTHASAVETVERLYKMGATKVEVEVYGDAEWAQTLYITQPEDAEAARKILAHIAGGFSADDVYEEEGILTVEWSS